MLREIIYVEVLVYKVYGVVVDCWMKYVSRRISQHEICIHRGLLGRSFSFDCTKKLNKIVIQDKSLTK